MMEEIGFLTLNQAMEHDVSLMNQDNGYIGNCLIGSDRDFFAIDGRVIMLDTEISCLDSYILIFLPYAKTSYPEIILVIDQEFLKACFGDICKFDLSLFRGGPSCASLRNVLFAAASSLHHLIDGAPVIFEESMGKDVGDIINDLSYTISLKVPVEALLRDEISGVCHGEAILGYFSLTSGPI